MGLEFKGEEAKDVKGEIPKKGEVRNRSEVVSLGFSVAGFSLQI